MPRLILSSVILIFSGFLVVAQEVKKDTPAKPPQWQRMLKGADAKKAEELESRTQLAIAFGNFKNAKIDAEQLLALRTKLQGDDHWQTANSRDIRDMVLKLEKLPAEQLAGWRKSLFSAVQAEALEQKGQFRTALPLREERLKWERTAVGEAQRTTAMMHSELASNLQTQGKHPQSQYHYEKAHEILRRVFGEDHPETASSYNNLGSSLAAQGKHAKAQPLFQTSLEISQRVLGEEHAGTANSYSNVGSNLDAQAKHLEAQVPLRKSLEIRRRILGENDLDTAHSYSNIAFNLGCMGKRAEAQPLYRRALEIHERVLGENHIATAICYNNLAANLSDQGQHAESTLLYQKSLDINKRVLGEEHIETGKGYSNLATSLYYQGQYPAAHSFYLKALNIFRLVSKEESEQTVKTLTSMGTNLNAQHKHAEARRLHEQALEAALLLFKEEHAVTAAIYNNLASTLSELNRPVEAQSLLEKALDISRRVLGEDHIDTGTSYNNLASNLDAQGKHGEAAPLYQKALEILGRLGASGNLLLARVYNNTASNLFIQRKTAECEKVLRSAISAFETSRIAAAGGIDRASIDLFNPRMMLGTLLIERDPNSAWNEVEFALARGSLDEQAKKRKTLLKPEEQVEDGKWRDQLLAIQPRLLQLAGRKRSEPEDREFDRLQIQKKEVEAGLAALTSALSQRQVASTETIRRALASDSALLFWVDFNDQSGRLQEHLGCVVRSKGEPKWVRLRGTGEKGQWSNEDSDLQGRLRFELAREDSSRDVPALVAKMRTQRIEPILKHLEGVKHLYVVSYHTMAGIPVELIAPEFTVGYVPSGSFLAQRPKPSNAENRLFAMGDPIYEINRIKRGTELPKGGLLIQRLDPNGRAAMAKVLVNDVLLKYGDSVTNTTAELQAAIKKGADSKEDITLTLWRIDGAGKVVELRQKVPPGQIGIIVANEPASETIAKRQKQEELLASLQGSWSDLPGTRYEVNQIGKLFENKQIITDSDASEQYLEQLRRNGELAAYRYLHFAVHGKGTLERAFDSMLILSQDQPAETNTKEKAPRIDNRVSAREVLDYWKLDSDLVTLSACETGFGPFGAGDGLLGFAQAFLLAGSRSVCLSLWKVDDTATALLMTRFYENLLGKRDGIKPMRKIEALKESKEWLRNLSGKEVLRLGTDLRNGVIRAERPNTTDLRPLPKVAKDEKPYSHPRYWAAFILIGDPD